MRLIVGRIAKPHGIRGEVVVDLRTDEPGVRFAVGSVLMTDSTALAPTHGSQGAGVPAVGSPAVGSQGAGAQPAEDVGRYGVLLRIPATLKIEAARPHQGRYIVLFDGFFDRTGAEVLRGVLLCVEVDAVTPSADPDDFSDHELIGLAVVDQRGEHLGEITRIDHAPAADLLVVRRPGGRSSLVPFVRAIVPEVDVKGGRVVITPPEGLLDL